MTSDPFFTSAEKILETQLSARDSNKELVRWPGVFWAKDVSLAVRNARTFRKLSESEWEKISLANHADLKSEPSPEKAKTISTKNLSRN